MNKRIISSLLALTVVLGMSAVMHADEEVAETKDEAVVTAAVEEGAEETAEEAVETEEETADEEVAEEAESLVITLTIGEKSIFTNGEETELDVAPVIINDRTMVPLRAIFEALGASVAWDEETKTVLAVKDDISVTLGIGQDKMFVNNDEVILDSPAVIVDDRTMVPLRAIAEAFGNNVAYDAETKTVTITNAEEAEEDADAEGEETAIEEETETETEAEKLAEEDAVDGE